MLAIVISLKNVKGFVAPDGKGDLFSTVIGFDVDFMKSTHRSADGFHTINAIDHEPDYLSECDSQGGLRDEAIRVGNACMNYSINTLNNMKNKDFNELSEDNLKNESIFSNSTFIYKNDNGSAIDYKRLSPIKYKDQVIKIYNFDKKNLLGAKTDGLTKVSVPKMTIFEMIPRSWDSGNKKLRVDYLQGYSVNININLMRKALLFQDQDINYYSSNQQGVGKCKLSNHPSFSPILSTTNFGNLPEALKMNLNDCTVKIQGKILKAEHILPLNSKQKIYTYNFGDGFWTSYNHSGEYQGNSFWGYYYTDANSASFSTDEAKGWGNDHAGVWAADGNGSGNWEVWDSAWNLLNKVNFGAITMATQPLDTRNSGTSKICLWGTGSQWTENNNILNELGAHPNGDC